MQRINVTTVINSTYHIKQCILNKSRSSNFNQNCSYENPKTEVKIQRDFFNFGNMCHPLI